MKNSIKSLLLSTFLFGNAICSQEIINEKISDLLSGTEQKHVLPENNESTIPWTHIEENNQAKATYIPTNVDIGLINKSGMLLPFATACFVLPIFNKLSIILNDDNKIDNITLKLRDTDTLKDLNQHVAHHIGVPADKNCRDFVITVNDLQDEDKIKCLEKLYKKNFNHEDALNVLVFNSNVICNDFPYDDINNCNNYFNLCEQKLKKEKSDEEFKLLIPLLILNRCAYNAFTLSSWDDLIKLSVYKENKYFIKSYRREITEEEAREKIQNNEEILLSYELIHFSGKFSTLIALKYNPTGNILTLTTFYPRKNSISLNDAFGHLSPTFFTFFFKDQMLDPHFLNKFIRSYTDGTDIIHLQAFCAETNRHEIESIYKNLTTDFSSNETDALCRYANNKKIKKQYKNKKFTTNSNYTQINPIKRSLLTNNKSYLGIKRKELLNKIEEKEKYIKSNNLFCRELKNDIIHDFNTLIKNDLSEELLFFYALFDEYSNINILIHNCQKIFNFINGEDFYDIMPQRILESQFNTLLYIISDSSMLYMHKKMCHLIKQMNEVQEKIVQTVLHTRAVNKIVEEITTPAERYELMRIEHDKDMELYEKNIKAIVRRMQNLRTILNEFYAKFTSKLEQNITDIHNRTDIAEELKKQIDLFAQTHNISIKECEISHKNESLTFHEFAYVYNNIVKDYFYPQFCSILYEYIDELDDLYNNYMKRDNYMIYMSKSKFFELHGKNFTLYDEMMTLFINDMQKVLCIATH